MRNFFILSLFLSILSAQNHTAQIVGSKLMWENSIHSRDIKVNYKEAKAYCKNIKIGTFQDWRLPTLMELLLIVDHTKVHPAIKKEITFINQKKMYWSSTAYVDESNAFWGVKYKDGSTKNASSHYDRYVRCVRETKEPKKASPHTQPKKIVKATHH